MKTLAIVLGLMLSVATANADTMYKGKLHDVAWDASMMVTETGETPCTSCSYYLYIKNIKTGAEIKVGETTQLTHQIVLPAEGRYRAGVQAVRIIDETPETSPVSWSDNALVCYQNETFFFRWVYPPVGSKNLRSN